jgi:hypothetical protein
MRSWKNSAGRALATGSIAIFSVLATGCTTPVPHHETFRKHHDDHLHHEGEMLVLNPSAEYLAALPELGLEVREIIDLESMQSKLYHLDITDDRHPFHTREHHEQRFPGIVADPHHHFEHHAVRRKTDKGYTARTATRWHKAGATCGKGIRIGIVDSGVDVDHQAFKGANVSHRSFKLINQKAPNAVHGTAVTAMLGGRSAWGGLLPGAEYLTANVFHRGKKGKNVGSTKAILRAVDWLLTKKVSVINLSVGGPRNKLLAEAVKHAKKQGVIMIASAGNHGPFTDKKSYPSAYKSVIAVTALDKRGRSPRFASIGDYIDFSAPGVRIWTAVPRGGKPMSGTSFAAPVITGFAAAALKYQKVKGVKGVRAYLRKHAKDRNKTGWDKYTGWGLVEMRPPC